MGHGWKTVGKNEISRKPCKCGQGFIIEYEYEEESDWHVNNRFSEYSVVECPNNCSKH